MLREETAGRADRRGRLAGHLLLERPQGGAPRRAPLCPAPEGAARPSPRYRRAFQSRQLPGRAPEGPRGSSHSVYTQVTPRLSSPSPTRLYRMPFAPARSSGRRRTQAVPTKTCRDAHDFGAQGGTSAPQWAPRPVRAYCPLASARGMTPPVFKFTQASPPRSAYGQCEINRARSPSSGVRPVSHVSVG